MESQEPACDDGNLLSFFEVLNLTVNGTNVWQTLLHRERVRVSTGKATLAEVHFFLCWFLWQVGLCDQLEEVFLCGRTLQMDFLAQASRFGLYLTFDGHQ